jgi:hypothetical protein
MRNLDFGWENLTYRGRRIPRSERMPTTATNIPPPQQTSKTFRPSGDEKKANNSVMMSKTKMTQPTIRVLRDNRLSLLKLFMLIYLEGRV